MTATGTEDYVTEYSYNNAQGKYTALLQKEVKTVEGEENPLDLTSNVEQTVYTYDANGNQITKTADGKTETNTYDGLNQLIGFTDGETTASYAYNVDGLRYEKIVDGQRINHVWDGSKQIVADVIDNQFYEAACYIRGTNLVAKYNYRNGNKSEYTYYTQNAHGDVVNLTDSDGEVTKTYKYDAFGVEKDIDYNDTNAFRYCGEYYDSESGTIYLRARYYDPTIGRFISRDSFAGSNNDPLSLNLYTYCENNPIYGIDPNGHFKLPNWAKVAIGVVAIGIGVAATVATGGAAAPALIGAAKVALVSAASSAAVSGAIGYATGGKEGLKQGLIDGAADGFMWGGIGAGVSQVASAVKKVKTVSTIAKSSSSSPLRLETTKRYQFTGDEAVQHFERHGKEVMDALGKKSYNLKNYVDDANYVIKNGDYVKELNGYVKLVGGKGSAKFAFTGMKNGGANISTFHIKSAKEIAKKAPKYLQIG